VWEDKESKAKEIPQAVSSIFEGTAESSGDTTEGGDSYTSPSVVSSISSRSPSAVLIARVTRASFRLPNRWDDGLIARFRLE